MPGAGESTEEQSEKTPKVSPLVKSSVFLGIFLLRILSGIPWIWGNLTAYVTSYYYAKGDNSSGDLINWIISVEMLTFNFALMIGNTVARKIGLRTTLFLGILLFNGGIFLTYITMQHSVIALCVTFGGIPGFAGGLVEAVQLFLIVRWTRRYHGLSTSSVQSAVVLGAVVVNLLLTWFINRNNEMADSTVDHKAVFTQKDVIERVPYVFLLYGAVSSILNFIGFFLVRENPGESDFITEMVRRFMSLKASAGEVVKLIKAEEKVRVRNLSTSTKYSLPLARYDVNDVTSLRQHNKDSNNDDLAITTGSNKNIDNHIEIPPPEVEEDITTPDLTPKQVLKKRSFYALLVFKAVQLYGFFVLNAYYKTFGLLYIPDDHFLTAVVMVKCLVTPICTWIAGLSLDKFGIKPTLIVVSSVFCIISSFFYLTPVDKWLYFFSCVFCGCAVFTMFCVTGATCVKLFGETHFTTIYGMTFISGYVMIPLLPLLSEWIISSFGWFVLFICMGFTAFINVLTLLWGLPRNK